MKKSLIAVTVLILSVIASDVFAQTFEPSFNMTYGAGVMKKRGASDDRYANIVIAPTLRLNDRLLSLGIGLGPYFAVGPKGTTGFLKGTVGLALTAQVTVKRLNYFRGDHQGGITLMYVYGSRRLSLGHEPKDFHGFAVGLSIKAWE